MAKGKRSVRRYFPRRRRRSGARKIPVLPIIGIVSTPAMGGAIRELMAGNMNGALDRLKGFVGMDTGGEINYNQLMWNWTPIIIGVVAHKAMNALGVNRMIAKIPLVNL